LGAIFQRLKLVQIILGLELCRVASKKMYANFIYLKNQLFDRKISFDFVLFFELQVELIS